VRSTYIGNILAKQTRRLVGKIADVILLYMFRHETISEFESVRFVCCDEDPEPFRSTVAEALELIKAYDPRRFRRVLDTADWIVDYTGPLGSGGGKYGFRRKAIWLDLGFDIYRDTVELAAATAGVIVHEATHGRLFAMGIPYDEETWIRVERMCCAEENQFLRRLDRVRDGLGSGLVREFRVSNWFPLRGISLSRKIYLTFARMREAS